MVKGYLVFENEQIWAEAILQVVLEIFEKNNVTQPSQSSDAYTVRGWEQISLKMLLVLYEKLLKFEGKKWSYFSHFHTLTWSNKHLKFHFRGYFTKSSFWHLKGEARAKIFTMLIAWPVRSILLSCATRAHQTVSELLVSWSEADHYRSQRQFDIWHNDIGRNVRLGD